PGLVDMIGYGAAASYEGAPAPELRHSTSAARTTAGADTDDNSADFAAGAPTPTNSAGETGAGTPEPTPEPTPTAEPTPEPTETAQPGEPALTRIRDVQGTGAASPMQGQTV